MSEVLEIHGYDPEGDRYELASVFNVATAERSSALIATERVAERLGGFFLIGSSEEFVGRFGLG